MKIRYKIGDACFDAANAASGQRLSRWDIEAAFQRVAEYRQRLQAEGNIDGMADRLRSFAGREAERTRVAAALRRRNAALHILVGDRLYTAIDSLIASGLSPDKALLALFEGTQRGVEGGRNSVAALNGAYEARYLGGLLADLQANRPHLVHGLADPLMDGDIMRELAELKKGGKPGITGNEDARYAARLFAAYDEMSRADLNRLGAAIGRHEGWLGSPTHDDVKMLAAGEKAWIAAILPRLDLARTFPDAGSAGEIDDALAGIYDTIVTGAPGKAATSGKGGRINPADLARSLGTSRVLHFRDAMSAQAYRNEFGSGSTVSSMMSHLRGAARMAANMEVLGPHPEVMLASLVDRLKRRIKDDPTLSGAKKSRQMKGLTTDAGALRVAVDVATDLVNRPAHATAAKIGNDIRALQAMVRFGGAGILSITDSVTAGVASQFRGSGFFKGFFSQLNGLRRGRPKGELAEISFLAGEGFDGIVAHVIASSAAVNGPIGRVAQLQEKVFRWAGASWWDDVKRATAGRVIAAEMGMRAKVGYADLPANYRHVLGLHGITAPMWDAIRQAEFRVVDGNSYITPDRIRSLPDEAVAGLARTADDARRNLELAVLRFFADETSYGIVEVDARTRRTMTQGTRPGTFAGEALRFIGQFKGFPMAFTQRVGGRAIFGHRKGAGLLERTPHIGTLLAGMTISGYVSTVFDDLRKGYWPPRDPADLKTWEAAFIKGGAAGIYADFLFGKASHFGGPLETAAGPALVSIADLGVLLLKARDAGLSSRERIQAADWLDYATRNTPLVNLAYVRPALDFLFLSSMREAMSPGYLRKTQRERLRDYGQKSFEPKPLRPFG
ncbi:hypothetical protein [Aminobacter carboxidus]|uniref:Uncharacterized protein n=1 Tax=Aminobacter carboxidus TaxID=376165 RepID=A0ABR9GY40_9HYPH|nr:hypothetical protein [Aminobacter carboxidus]MBE1208444.1 hypothetical protein [Aminobacter carboxidus]